MNNVIPTCPRCGAPLPTDAPQNLCPRCLMALNLDTETLAPTAVAAALVSAVPTIEALADHFPQLEILECLGRGGMGVVYKARQKSLDRLVALKLLAPEREGDPAFAERFGREARALAALNHPNIVTVHDFGQAGGYYFLLMEYVDGLNLRQAMRVERFTPEQALAMVPPLCAALQYAHDRGVVHRDIKPENLLLDKEGRLKIADFGIARMIGGSAEASTSATPNQGFTMSAGTPAYMAPEQAANPAAVDHRADIYSLGVVLYELLTGERPKEKLEPPSKRVSIDVRLDEVVLRALEKDPERRYGSAAEFRTRVETVADAVRRTEPKPASGFQAFLQSVLPRHWFEAIRLQSHDWHMVCPCGHEISVWDAGGIRFAAAGNPRRKMFCPACHRFRWCTTIWRGPERHQDQIGSQDAAPAAAGPGALSYVALSVPLFYALLMIGFLILEMLPITSDSAMMTAVAISLPSAIFFSIHWLNRWDWQHEGPGASGYLKGFSLTAWIMAVPVLCLSLFFMLAVANDTDGWHPRPSEAFAASLSWLGVLPLPWAGWHLWSFARRASERKQPASRAGTGCAIAAVIVLVALLGIAIPAALTLWARLQTPAPLPRVDFLPGGGSAQADAAAADAQHKIQQKKRTLRSKDFEKKAPPISQ